MANKRKKQVKQRTVTKYLVVQDVVGCELRLAVFCRETYGLVAENLSVAAARLKFAGNGFSEQLENLERIGRAFPGAYNYPEAKAFSDAFRESMKNWESYA